MCVLQLLIIFKTNSRNKIQVNGDNLRLEIKHFAPILTIEVKKNLKKMSSILFLLSSISFFLFD